MIIESLREPAEMKYEASLHGIYTGKSKSTSTQIV